MTYDKFFCSKYALSLISFNDSTSLSATCTAVSSFTASACAWHNPTSSPSFKDDETFFVYLKVIFILLSRLYCIMRSMGTQTNSLCPNGSNRSSSLFGPVAMIYL